MTPADNKGSAVPVDLTTVPAGSYRVRVDEVRPGTTREGSERWSMLLRVSEGPYAGRLAAWDSIVFRVRGRIRARAVLDALGLPKQGRIVVDPDDLLGREAIVDVQTAEYHVPFGTPFRRNEVPHGGWRPATAGGAA